MNRVYRGIILCLAVVLVYGVLHRILRAREEERFQIERSRCQLVLVEVWQRSSVNATLVAPQHEHRYYSVDWVESANSAVGVLKRPLVYDKCLSNHGGRGINILMADGTVMWDQNASWLKTFAMDNHAVRLHLPE